MKYKVSFECNKTAMEHVTDLLKYFEMMGKLGMTRDFIVEDNRWFTFDGDGQDRIENIKIEDLELK